jgi:hypothetical protein
VHALTNTSETEALSLLVVELTTAASSPIYPPSWCHLLQELQESEDFYPVLYSKQLVRPRLARADLRRAFSGTFGTLSLVELPPGSHIEPFIEPDDDQLLFVVHGHATFTLLRRSETMTTGIPEANDTATFDESAKPIVVHSDDRSHQSVLVPRGVPCGWTNRASGKFPLLIARLTVRPERGRQEKLPLSLPTNLEQPVTEIAL